MTEVLTFGVNPEAEEKKRTRRVAEKDSMVAADVAAAEAGKPTPRSRSAVVMRAQGFTFVEIAEQLEYTDGYAARAAYMATIAALYDPESTKTQRALQKARLEMLFKSVVEIATDQNDPSHLSYNRRAQEILADISKLEGLNAPVTVAMVNPDAEKLDEVVQHLIAVTVGDANPEGDILALEEGDDGVFAAPEGAEEEGEYYADAEGSE